MTRFVVGWILGVGLGLCAAGLAWCFLLRARSQMEDTLDFLTKLRPKK